MRKLSTKREYSMYWTPVHQKAPCTHTHNKGQIKIDHSTSMIWEESGKSKGNPKRETS